MATGWGVTQEAITAFNDTAKELDTMSKTAETEAAKLEDTYTPNQQGLGYHAGDIQKLLTDVKETATETGKTLTTLSKKMLKAAAIRQAHINKKRYTAGNLKNNK